MDRCKSNELRVLLQTVDQPSASAMSAAPLPVPLPLLQSAEQPDNPRPYVEPPDASGHAERQQPPVQAQGDPAVRTLSKTTLWRRKNQKEKPASNVSQGTALLPARKDKIITKFNCSLCGKPKTKEFGHSRFRSENFCSSTAGRSVEEWLAEKRNKP